MIPKRPLVIPVLVAALAGCGGRTGPATPSVDLAAEKAAVRARSQAWLVADSTKNVEAAVAFYAPDAVELADNTPPAVGTGAIRAWYRAWLPDPHVKITFATVSVDVSASGDVAYERGTYAFTTMAAKGETVDRGKYLTVWKKMDGVWMVAADMANSDLPLTTTP